VGRAFFILAVKKREIATKAEVERMRRKGDEHMFQNFGPVANRGKKGRRKRHGK
jgi:hypothetical protein